MKICYFGTYEKDYSRNRVFIDGLRQKNVKVVECHEPLWEKVEHKDIKNLIKLIPNAVIAYSKLFFRALSIKKDFDYVIVGYPPSIDVFIAKMVFKKKIVFNPLVSLYDTLVEDRKFVKGSLSKFIEFLDKTYYKTADMVFIDTKAHADYLIKKYPLLKNKIGVVYVGADEKLFYPKQIKREGKFLVYFHGKFIPLHGLDKIILAAKLLENNKDISFLIIGSGQLEKEISELIDKNGVKNVKRIEWISYPYLINFINKADVCLGIFGNTEKARIVVPNKVFQCIACKKPIITMKSPASEEVFTNKKDAILCETSAKAIANSILLLKKNKKLRDKIAKNGYTLFKENFISKKIGERIKNLI